MSDGRATGDYATWLNRTDEDMVWSAAIREYLHQVKCSEEGAWEAERGDRILWSMIQTGLSKTENEKGVLSDSHLQVKHFAAVMASRLHRLHESEKKQLDEFATQLTELAKSLIASDQATTVSCPH